MEPSKLHHRMFILWNREEIKRIILTRVKKMTIIRLTQWQIAVFTACFLNAMNRNCDIVGMANFAPVLNTRGVYTAIKDARLCLEALIMCFDLYVNYLGDTVIDLWAENEIPMITVKHKIMETWYRRAG